MGTEDYRSRVIVAPAGGVTVQLQRTTTVLTNVGTSLNVAAGDALHVRTEATGTSPTTLRVKVWKVGTAEPTAWTSTTTDSTAGLQAAGHIGIGVYLGGSATNVPFRTQFDNLWAGSSNGSPVAANQAPTASFTATSNDLAATVDASASTDADGTIASYAWEFGDGGTATGKTPAAHTYAAAGSYTVKLTVTDDKGATDSTTKSVTVTAPAGPANQAPTASFTATPNDLAVTVDASASTDADGTIASYAWEFGDGGTATGKTPAAHTYAAAGNYTVKLTVTDNQGATNSTTRSVTVTAPAGAAFAADDFGRAAGVLGAAQTGGTWTQTTGTANVAIDNGAARFTTQSAGQTRSATLQGATSTSTDLTFSFTMPSLPTGARVYISALGRVVGSDDYRGRWLVSSTGAVQAQLSRVGTVLVAQDLNGVTLAAGTKYNIRLQVFGTGTTTIRSKIWADGAQEPANWQLSTTDSTAGLQVAGYTGMTTYAGSGLTGLPFNVLFDNYRAVGVTP